MLFQQAVKIGRILAVSTAAQAGGQQMLHSHLAMGSQELIKYFTYFEGMTWAGIGNYRALLLQRF